MKSNYIMYVILYFSMICNAQNWDSTFIYADMNGDNIKEQITIKVLYNDYHFSDSMIVISDYYRNSFEFFMMGAVSNIEIIIRSYFSNDKKKEFLLLLYSNGGNCGLSPLVLIEKNGNINNYDNGDCGFLFGFLSDTIFVYGGYYGGAATATLQSIGPPAFYKISVSDKIPKVSDITKSILKESLLARLIYKGYIFEIMEESALDYMFENYED